MLHRRDENIQQFGLLRGIASCIVCKQAHVHEVLGVLANQAAWLLNMPQANIGPKNTW